ncbi:hypothetical protein EK21DRAFT_91132 [Setomelanomma holmii]|uniref:DUF7600 domain-containing protein n=1 Tax=Setomelanomma holmii TaxID=210430 RepID=A0A9P4H6L9_9PLEO|nr:hypothetical protein EK21DRAFT_91132 [Setomelanomma holmii]
MSEYQVVNWGHTYGGLYASDDVDNSSMHLNPEATRLGVFWQCDPIILNSYEIVRRLNIHETECRLRQSICHNQRGSPIAKTLFGNKEVWDCFWTLPTELIEHIMMLLPSRDVLNAKLSSRAVAGTPLNKSFWHSRFRAGQDLEYVIEPWLHKVGAIKPIVYALRSFTSHQSNFGTAEPTGRALASIWQPKLEPEDTARWECAYGQLLDSEFQPFHLGCRPLFKRYITLSQPVVAVKVSVLPFYNGITYVTGLRLCLADSSEETIGYILESNETTLLTGGILRGFRVTYSDRGIHALCILNKTGSYSAIAGSASEHKEKKIGFGTPVTKVKAYFDGMKMVYVALFEYLHTAIGPYTLWKQAQDYIQVVNLPKA